jgi:hypothetical protein
MFNHFRTLLLNRADSGFDAAPAGELVPTEFRPVALPSYLQDIRGRLFGITPDLAMLNYRLKQYLTLLRCTELEQFVLDLDPRITYDAADEHDLVPPDLFQPKVTQVDGVPTNLLMAGTSTAPDYTGEMHYQYNLNALLSQEDGHTATAAVKRVLPDPQLWISPLVLTGGVSDYFDLPGSGYRAALTTTNPATSFIIEGYRRPQWSLGQIAALVEATGEPNMLSLFGVQKVEPWLTFSNLWYEHPELPYQLGGLLLAVAYRTEEVRLVHGTTN